MVMGGMMQLGDMGDRTFYMAEKATTLFMVETGMICLKEARVMTGCMGTMVTTL